MKLQDYSGQAFLQHLENKDKALIQRVNELDDLELKNTIYEVAQIIAKFAIEEDENILNSIDFLEDRLNELEATVEQLQRENRYLFSKLDELEQKII